MGSIPYIYIKEKLIPGAPPSIPVNILKLIYDHSKNSIFKIETENAIGTGFLCLIPFPDKLHPLPTLITNNHVLTENDIKIGKIIKFSSNEHNYQIVIDNARKCYTNIEYDITIIEIKKNDGISINNILEINEDIFKNNAFEIFSKSSVYIMHYPNGVQNEISFGKIKNISIDNLNIEHLCNTLPGSSGGAIMNMINYKVIGIHKSSIKIINWNLGSLLKLPIEKFNEVFSYKEDNKNDNNNENNSNIEGNKKDEINKNIKNNEKNNEINNLEEDKLPDNEFSLFNSDLQEDNNKNNKNEIEKDKIQVIQNDNILGDKLNDHNGNNKKENSNYKENEKNKNFKIINNNINNIKNKNNQNINNNNIKNEEIINKQIYISNSIPSQSDINPNLILNEEVNNNNKINLILSNDNNIINNKINNEENIVDEITIFYSKENIKSINFF